MTEQEMMQETLDFWRREYPKEFKMMPKDDAMRQATACAGLTRMEMDALKRVNPKLTDEMAWSESRHLFCMTPPPVEPEPTARDLELEAIIEESVIPRWKSGMLPRGAYPEMEADLHKRLRRFYPKQSREEELPVEE